MKFETGSLVAVNFYDNKGNCTKKRAIGKVLTGTDTTPPSDHCRIELIYPTSCKGTQIGVLTNDLRHLGIRITEANAEIPWQEVVLQLARELDEQYEKMMMC